MLTLTDDAAGALMHRLFCGCDAGPTSHDPAIQAKRAAEMQTILAALRALATPLGADWRARAAEVRRQIQVAIGPRSGWAFFNPGKVEEPIAIALADAYAAGMREERDRCAALAESFGTQTGQRAAAAEARAARLAVYTTHRATCLSVLLKIDEKPCTCGLDAALRKEPRG
jgi:hypothetical protein